MKKAIPGPCAGLRIYYAGTPTAQIKRIVHGAGARFAHQISDKISVVVLGDRLADYFREDVQTIINWKPDLPIITVAQLLKITNNGLGNIEEMRLETRRQALELAASGERRIERNQNRVYPAPALEMSAKCGLGF